MPHLSWPPLGFRWPPLAENPGYASVLVAVGFVTVALLVAA